MAFDPTSFPLRIGFEVKCLDCAGQPILNPGGATPNVFAIVHLNDNPTHHLDLSSMVAVTNEYYIAPAGGGS